MVACGHHGLWTSTAIEDDAGASTGAESDGGVHPLGAAAMQRPCAHALNGAGRAPVLIARGQSQPSSLAVDGAAVYFGIQVGDGGGGGAIVKCPVDGCGVRAPTTVADHQDAVWRMAARDGSLYWMTLGGSLTACPTSGCGGAPPSVFSQTGTWAFALGPNDVYWIDTNVPSTGPPTSRVASCPLSGCAAPSILYEVHGELFGLAVDAANVYFTDDLGRVLAVPPVGLAAGESPRLLTISTESALDMTVGAGNLYWDGADGVQWVSASASVVPWRTTHAAPSQGIVFDPACSEVYWAWPGTYAGLSGAGGVWRCAATGCGDAGPEAFGLDQGVSDVAIDDAYVYWVDSVGGNVWKIAK
jgi:hypothetical protein